MKIADMKTEMIKGGISAPPPEDKDSSPRSPRASSVNPHTDAAAIHAFNPRDRSPELSEVKAQIELLQLNLNELVSRLEANVAEDEPAQSFVHKRDFISLCDVIPK